VDIINECAQAASNVGGINMMELPQGSLRYKLMTTYLSYLPKEKAIYDLKMNVDPRGSFTELVHSLNCGQVSINISKPGITKGQHWHHSKWETFIVVAGRGLIQLRNEADPNAPILNYEVSGEKIQAVQMLPGYTHNIINLSDSEDLVTVMYCNEIFNPNRPDTYFDPVE
jgi:UDP-2-acetamido-2,6-beta-L-arabino-hexul-4-ose reductase